MKINSVIIDDEVSNRNVLKNLLGKFCPEIEILGEASNVENAYHLINLKNPDLVFLDIQMPNGNGFSLLKKFSNIPFNVIFVTSFDQYAINAIRYNALDYLLKPLEVNDLIDAVKKAKNLIAEKSNNTAQIVNLLNDANESDLEKSLAVHDKGKVRFLKLNQISHFESEINYTHIYMISGEKIITTRILKDIDEVLEQHALFLRINKSCIVNINCIKNYSKKEPLTLTLVNGKEFEISRRKKQEVNERLGAL